MPRAKSIQIYLKDGLDEDDMLLALWESCKRRSRPQVVFRRMLMKGFDAMVAEGELPQSITEEMQAVQQEDKFGGSRRPVSKPKTDGLDVQGAEVWQQLHGVPEETPEPQPAKKPEPQPREQNYENSRILDSMMEDEPPMPEAPKPIPQQQRPERPYRPATPVEKEEASGDDDDGHGFIGDIM